MKTLELKLKHVLALALAAVLASTPVLAEKPESKKGGKEQRTEKREKPSKEAKIVHFKDDHRTVVREYYDEQFRSGRCPPGLAKKNNGCLPPGQAKKWQMGQPLSRSVVYHDVPETLVVRFGPPPVGHRYVRVDGDILLIATATRLIVDALQN
jgi:Ni/Co efflux regulator RcnB